MSNVPTPRESGFIEIKKLVIILAVVVGGILLVKVGGAYLDVSGIQADLQAVADDLKIHCLQENEECREQLIDQIEGIRKQHTRDVEINYESLRYSGEENRLYMNGRKRIDFRIRQVTWNFEIGVDISF